FGSDVKMILLFCVHDGAVYTITGSAAPDRFDRVRDDVAVVTSSFQILQKGRSGWRAGCGITRQSNGPEPRYSFCRPNVPGAGLRPVIGPTLVAGSWLSSLYRRGTVGSAARRFVCWLGRLFLRNTTRFPAWEFVPPRYRSFLPSPVRFAAER